MLLSATTVRLKDGTSVTLRSARVDEAGAVLEYLRTLFHESWRQLQWGPKRYDTATEAEQAASIQRFTDAKSDFMLTAFLGDRVVGDLVLGAMQGDLCAHAGQFGIGILREYQGRGLGTLLVRRAIEEAARLGIWNLRLNVRVTNPTAIALYERLGFKRVGKLEATALVEGEEVDEYLYQRIAR